MSLDLTIIGIVFAIILLIIFFSAIVLYLAFRIKETFRKETRRGLTIAKVGFLVGILFLAGGMFYFFANTLGNVTRSEATLNLSVSNPQSVSFNSNFTITFTVMNPTTIIAHGATIQASLFFAEFSIITSTHEVVGNVINIGVVQPGTTIVALEVLAPSKPGTVSDVVELVFQEMTEPVTKLISISVEGGQSNTSPVIPEPTPTDTPVLSLSVAYPSSVSLNSNFTVSFTIRNLTNFTAHGATIEANALFTDFVVISSTRKIIGNVMDVGDIPPGTTIVSLQLLSTSRPGTVTDTVSLLFQEMTAPVAQQIVISIRGGQ
jgi:hypothetical protein